MRIHVNGQERSVEARGTLACLLEALGLAASRIAVEVNEEVVPASRHADTVLAAGDRIEVVHAIGGG
ncbi:sulfur carrier protein ThiS [Halomonas stenophila]|nr:sulfur carrier protein ThiS [Halomonas stenophila]